MISKNNGTVNEVVQKIGFGEDPRGGRYPQTTSTYLYLKYLVTAKNTGTLAWAIQKFSFWVVHLEGASAGWYPQTLLKYFPVNIYW